MCLITFNPHGRSLPEDRMRIAFANNNDGYGFMWNEDGRVKFLKEDGSGGVERFIGLCKEFEGRAHSIHLRWRTHGSLGIAQAHPHVILSKDEGDKIDFVMMHNGVFNGLPDDKIKSDTMILAERIRDRIRSSATGDIKAAIQGFSKNIGTSNRVLFLNSFGKAIFLNADLGFWDNGVWYSNTYSFHGLGYSVKPVTHYTLSGGKLVARSSVGNGNGALAPVPAKKVVSSPAATATGALVGPMNPTGAANLAAIARAAAAGADEEDDVVIWPQAKSKLARDLRSRSTGDHARAKSTAVPVLRGKGTIPSYPEVQRIVNRMGQNTSSTKNKSIVLSGKLLSTAKRPSKADRRAARKALKAERKLARKTEKQIRTDKDGNKKSVRVFSVEASRISKVEVPVSSEYPPTEARLLSRGKF